MKRLFLRSAVVLLAMLAALIVYIEFCSTPLRRFNADLKTVVPAELAGWEVRDIPLTETQGSLENVRNVLQYDDVVQRLYRKGGLEVLVYTAYWKPGKVTTADAGTHNPDSCWVLAGWTRHERQYGVPLTLAGRTTLPAEEGVYSIRNHATNVIFWHLVNGEPNRYEDQQTGWRHGLAGRIERLPLAFEDIRKYGLNMKREQLFIRISANRPLPALIADPDFAALLNRLDDLGIFKDKPWR